MSIASEIEKEYKNAVEQSLSANVCNRCAEIFQHCICSDSTEDSIKLQEFRFWSNERTCSVSFDEYRLNVLALNQRYAPTVPLKKWSVNSICEPIQFKQKKTSILHLYYATNLRRSPVLNRLNEYCHELSKTKNIDQNSTPLSIVASTLKAIQYRAKLYPSSPENNCVPISIESRDSRFCKPMTRISTQDLSRSFFGKCYLSPTEMDFEGSLSIFSQARKSNYMNRFCITNFLVETLERQPMFPFNKWKWSDALGPLRDKIGIDCSGIVAEYACGSNGLRAQCKLFTAVLNELAFIDSMTVVIFHDSGINCFRAFSAAKTVDQNEMLYTPDIDLAYSFVFTVAFEKILKDSLVQLLPILTTCLGNGFLVLEMGNGKLNELRVMSGNRYGWSVDLTEDWLFDLNLITHAHYTFSDQDFLSVHKIDYKVEWGKFSEEYVSDPSIVGALNRKSCKLVKENEPYKDQKYHIEVNVPTGFYSAFKRWNE